MKKLLAWALLICMMFSMFSLSVAAAVADDDESDEPIEEKEGLTFGQEYKYEMSVLLDAIPFVVEAWIYFPPEHQGYGGMIFGNNGILQNCFQLEILAGGVPRLFYSTSTNEFYKKDRHEIHFSNVNVYTGEWVHLAVTIDDSTNEAHCFVNGALAQSVSGMTMFDRDVLAVPFAVGGDHRGFNSSYFRGEMHSLALYSDFRDIRKIRNDLKSVDTRDEDLLAYYDFSDQKEESYSDHRDGKYDLLVTDWWLEEKKEVKDYAYSLCLVGDTQIEAHYDTDSFPYIYDWIVENAKKKKMAYVIGLGDIVDKNPDEEWQLAYENIIKLNGVVPYSLVRGNHDSIQKLNELFYKDWYTRTCDGLFEQGHIENSFRTFRAGKTDYLIMTLEYGPRDVVLDWAAEVLERYPNHKAIITTHAYMTRDGSRLDAEDYHSPTYEKRENNGEDMWNKVFSQYANVFMIICGHIDCETVVVNQEKGVHGNIVTQILIDMQGISLREYKQSGALGSVTMLYFNEDGTMAEMETYSTVRELFFRSNNQRTLSFVEAVEENPDVGSSESIDDTTESTLPEEQEEEKPPILPIVILCVVGGVLIAVAIVVTVVIVRKRKNNF